MSQNDIAQEISQLAGKIPDRFLQLSTAAQTHKPNAEKWSKQEILGHLIDSAVHNLTRFTQAQYLSAPFQVKPYNQDELVKINGYQQAPPEELVRLWQALNRQIARVIAQCPAATVNNPVTLPDNSPVTLAWLMEDYLRHLKHHLRQIF